MSGNARQSKKDKRREETLKATLQMETPVKGAVHETPVKGIVPERDMSKAQVSESVSSSGTTPMTVGKTPDQWYRR